MEIEKFVEECLNDYDEQMADTVNSAKSSSEIEMCHHEVKSDILEKLPMKWRRCNGTSEIPDDVQKLVSQRLESTLKLFIKFLEKSNKREKSTTTENDAMNYYNDEMELYFRNHPNASLAEIVVAHCKYSKLALARAESKAGTELSTEVLEAINSALETRKMVYFQRAIMVLMSNEDPAIGIDLGTTMCCVMVFHKGKCELVPNRSQGNSRTTPSYVAFHENGKDTFGHVAKEEAYRQPETTIYDAKRMIGRPFSDEKLQNDMKKWPFEVTVENQNVKIRTWDRLRYPHEVSARLLTRLRMMAEEHLGFSPGTIKKAVITVPAYFSEPQRRATSEAATCAGLHVLNILSEPTAAAIAYSWENRDTEKSRKALIYDLGGGTFDVAIAKVNATNVDILCVDGDTHLGGQDFDQLIMDYCLKEFKSKENIDLSALRDSDQTTVRIEARGALSRLKLQCEKAKEWLTGTDSTIVQINKIYDGKDLYVDVTKSQVETLVRPLVQKTIDIIERALKAAESKGITSKADIDDVILVGGSTRMPIVMDMVSKFFDGKQLYKHINPDEAVAYGAAIQAAILNKNERVEKIQVEDVTPLSLGVRTLGDKFSIVIPKNSKIPCSHQDLYVTVEDDQDAVTSMIYQGDDEKASSNKWLGQFSLSGFPLKPAGEEVFKIKMTIDSMGILQVVMESLTTGDCNSLVVTADRMGMDKATMNRVADECKQIGKDLY